jgi:predicted lipoprotein
VADEKLRERQEKRQKILQRWNQSDGFHAKDMAPVTDNNLRRGWKRGRYGRAIAVMRLKRPNGSTVKYI